MPEPSLSESFEWIAHAWGRSLRCRALAEIAPHLFTAREPRLSATDAAAEEGWPEVAAALGVPAGRLVRLMQVHGARVVAVAGGAPPVRADGTWGEADAAMTDDPDLAVAVKVADCVPILIADRRLGVVSAVHAGWRGTAAGVARAAVGALAERYGARPGDLVAAIGPSIGPCCCQVGTEVSDRFIEGGASPASLADWFSVSPAPGQHPGAGLGAAARAAGTAVQPGKLWLDTWQANVDQLVEAGVPRRQVHASGVCTVCCADIFHSYRVDGPRAGRMAAAIRSAAQYVAPDLRYVAPDL